MDKKYIELNGEIDLYLEPVGSKVEYLFKRNENKVSSHKGEVPLSITSRMKIGQEIIKYLDSNNELKKEILNQKFDEIKEEAQKLYEQIVEFEEKKKKLKEKRKKDFLRSKNKEAGEFYKSIDMPVMWIYSLIGWLTAGEENNIILGFLAYCCQVILGEPISVIYVGDGSTGKDHVKDSAYIMIPDNIIVMEKLVSQAAIFRRSQENPYFYDGKIVDYGDLGGENSHEDAENSKALMKELQTDGYLNKPVPVQIEGQWFLEDLELKGKPALTYTTVPNYNFDEQDMSRSIFISPRIDNRNKYQKRYKMLGFKGETYYKFKTYEKEIQKVKHILCHLKDIFRTPDGDMKIEIINPYVDFIIGLFDDSSTFKREIPKYENILKIIAALNYHKKKIYEHNGRKVIYISLEDVQLFFNIINVHLKGVRLNLSPKASDILEDLHSNFDKWINKGDISEEGFTVDEYFEVSSFDLKKRSIYSYFKELRDLGLIKVNHKEGMLHFYVLSGSLDLKDVDGPNFEDIDKEMIIDIAGEDIREFLEEDSLVEDLNITKQHEDIETPPWK